jgi:hypothetical protein
VFKFELSCFKIAGFVGDVCHGEVKSETMDALEVLCVDSNCSTFMLLLSSA